jgi:hypothetical protein
MIFLVVYELTATAKQAAKKGEKTIPQGRLATWAEARAYQPAQIKQAKSKLNLRPLMPSSSFRNLQTR